MANHKSALKRARQSERRRLRNKARKTRVKNLIRAVNEAVKAKDLEAARERLRLAQSIIDRTAQKGTLHWKNAARKVSRLARKVEALAKGSAA